LVCHRHGHCSGVQLGISSEGVSQWSAVWRQVPVGCETHHSTLALVYALTAAVYEMCQQLSSSSCGHVQRTNCSRGVAVLLSWFQVSLKCAMRTWKRRKQRSSNRSSGTGCQPRQARWTLPMRSVLQLMAGGAGLLQLCRCLSAAALCLQGLLVNQAAQASSWPAMSVAVHCCVDHGTACTPCKFTPDDICPPLVPYQCCTWMPYQS